MTDGQASIWMRRPLGVDSLLIRLPPDDAAVPAARDFATGVARAWGFTALGELAAVISELVTNAVRHGRGGPVIRVSRDGPRHVVLEACDRHPGSPVARRRDPEQVGSYGLRLVESLSESWGITDVDDAEVVWSRVALPPPSDDAGPPTPPR